MRHKNKNKILDRKKEPREMMLRNMASSLIIYEKIVTTEAKAKAVRPLVEKIIKLSAKNNLNTRRMIIKILPQKMAVKKIMEVLGGRYKDRNGGYTRINKMNPRQGDGAKVVQLELV